MGYKKSDIQSLSDSIHNSEYEIIGDYININSKCLTRHKMCGYEWMINLNNHIHKLGGCPKCYGNIKLNNERINEIISKFDFKLSEYLDDILVIVHGCGSNKKISIKSIHGNLTCKDCSNKKIMSYSEAKSFLYKSGITKQSLYRTFYSNYNLPSNPYLSYRNEWVSWADFLSTKSKNFVRYNECKRYAIDNNIKNSSEWSKWLKKYKPNSIPSNPYKVYNEWISWMDFLDNECNKFPDKDTFMKIIEENNIRSKSEYLKIYKSLSLPSNPVDVYSTSWLNIFKKSVRIKDYLNFIESKKYIVDNDIKTKKEYLSIAKNTYFLSCSPHITYKNEWISWNDFLNKEDIVFYDYAQTKLIISGRFNSQLDFKECKDLDSRIPRAPDCFYKSDWISWSDFLGYERLSSKGERLVEKSLMTNNIHYIKQKRFKGCKNIRELPFDFYLICIEYDGEQHFKSIDVYGGETRYLNVVKCDLIKTNYCLDNGIKLIRIAYFDYDRIETILKENLISIS